MPTALTNTSFETAGPLRGLADAWHRHARRNGRMIAGFAERAVDPIVDASEFNTAAWTLTELSVTTNVVTAPDDTVGADLLEETAVNDYHAVYTSDPAVFESGQTYTIGVYLLADGRNFGGIGLLTTGGYVMALANLSTGRITAYPSAAGEIEKVHASSILAAGGWVRVALTFSVTDALSASPTIFVSADGATTVYAGTPGSGIYAWGAFAHGGDLRDVERFAHGWLVSENVDSPFAVDPALFLTGQLDPVTHDEEDFEIGWNNHPLKTEISLAAIAVFNTGDLLNNHVEAFDNEWNGNSLGAIFEQIEVGEQAEFAGTGTTETFSRGWSGSDDFSETITTSDEAMFDGDILHVSSEPYEDFEETYADVPFDVDNLGTSTFAADHSFPDGTPVYARVSTNGHLPAGLNGIQRYYVRDAVAGVSLRLSLTEGGSAVTITDFGEGTFTLRADPLHFWSGDDVGDS